jgi:uncharacterized protein
MKAIEFRDEAAFGSIETEAILDHRRGHRREALCINAADGLTQTRHAKTSLSAWFLLAFLRFYILFLSPVFGGACKFYPSCSNYAVEAVTKHGARRGFILAAKRLLRCRPFTQGGFDPVPDDLPHSGGPKIVEEKALVLPETDSEIQRTERRLL